MAREGALLREEVLELRGSREGLEGEVARLREGLQQFREEELRQKQLMVAKLELLEEEEMQATENIGDERVQALEKRLEVTQDALFAGKKTHEEMVKLNNQQEVNSQKLKEQVIDEEIKTKEIKAQLDESREQTRQHFEESLRQKTKEKVKDAENSKLGVEIQALGQDKQLLVNQLQNNKDEMETIISNCNKLNQDLKAKSSELERCLDELSNLKQIANQFSVVQEQLNDVRHENIEIKRQNLLNAKFKEENENNMQKLKSLQLKVDLNHDNTENVMFLTKENRRINEALIEDNNQILTLSTMCNEFTLTKTDLEKQILKLTAEKRTLLEDIAQRNDEIENLRKHKTEHAKISQKIETENTELKINISKLEKQFNDEKIDLAKVIQQLENVQKKLLKDKSHDVSFKEELFEELQNSDRENKEKIKIMDSSLKHSEIRLQEQTIIKEECLRELGDIREVEREQQTLIRMQKEKLRRLETELKTLKEENKRKEEALTACRIDLLQLEKEKGQLSAVNYENKALKDNCILLEKNLEKFNDCQDKVSILEHGLFKSKETVHDREEKIMDLQKMINELKFESKNFHSEISKEKQEVQRLNIGLEAADVMIQKAQERDAVERVKYDVLQEELTKIHNEKLMLQKSQQSHEDTIGELKIELESKQHMENVLEDRMITLNLHLQEKNQTISLKNKEAKHKENLHKKEIDQLHLQIGKKQKNFNDR